MLFGCVLAACRSIGLVRKGTTRSTTWSTHLVRARVRVRVSLRARVRVRVRVLQHARWLVLELPVDGDRGEGGREVGQVGLPRRVEDILGEGPAGTRVRGEG